jgi:hypothetical protein
MSVLLSPTRVLLHPDLGRRPDEPLRRVPARGRRRANGACDRLPFSLRRNREAPLFCRLHRLTIEDGRARLTLTPGSFADICAKSIVNSLPRPIQSPFSEVVIDRSPRRNVAGHEAPLPACAEYVADPVDDFPLRILFGTAAALRLRNERLEHGPLGIGEVRRIALRCWHPYVSTTDQISPRIIGGFFDTLLEADRP